MVAKRKYLKPYIGIGLPHLDMVSFSWAFHMLVPIMATPLNWCKKDIIHCAGLPVEPARNLIVQEFLKDSNFTHLLFIDSDQITIENVNKAITKLFQHTENYQIVSGVTRSKRWVNKQPVWGIYKEQACSIKPIELLPSRPFVCDDVTMGFCLISKYVFEKIPYPWFTWSYPDSANLGRGVGEDITFCRKAREAGFKILVDPSVQLFHEDLLAICPDGTVEKYR
jgi:hypothetical protein